MFGDILSDETSVITGSLRCFHLQVQEKMILVYTNQSTDRSRYCRTKKANPAATILSTAMMLANHSQMETEAVAIEEAVLNVLNDGIFTGDLQVEGKRVLSTTEWTAKVLEELDSEFVSDSIMFTYV